MGHELSQYSTASVPPAQRTFQAFQRRPPRAECTSSDRLPRDQRALSR